MISFESQPLRSPPPLMHSLQFFLLALTTIPCVAAATRAQSLSVRLKAEGAAALADAAREEGDAVRGAILFAQEKLACSQCHAAGRSDLLGPDLHALPRDATDVYLVESLLEPSKAIRKGFESVTLRTVDGKILTGRLLSQDDDGVTLRDAAEQRRQISVPLDQIDEIAPKAKSAMPDNLVDQLRDRQELLDLVRYVMALRESAGGSANSPAVADAQAGPALHQLPALRGLVLIDEFQCAACHENDLGPSPFPPKQAPDLRWAAGRLHADFIERFIADPAKIKAGTSMPNVMHGLSEVERRDAAREITHYLLSVGKYELQKEVFDASAAEEGRELFHTIGCVACHAPRDDAGDEIQVKDSAPLENPAEKFSLTGLASFLLNPLASRPSGRMPDMLLSEGEAKALASYLVSLPAHQRGQGHTPLAVDRELAERGRSRFRDLGCVRCHDQGWPSDDSGGKLRSSIALSQVRADRGCLSQQPGPWPDFQLTSSQHAAIIAATQTGSVDLTGEQQIAASLLAFRCTNCHQRGQLGGVSAERDPYFQTTNANLGPNGRIPPQLTGVGAKLKPRWLRQVLVSGRAIRPYVKTRMPRFGADNVEHLVDLLPQVDQPPLAATPTYPESKEFKDASHQLVGKDGLNCIACHTFRLKGGATMPAVDLTEMAERLNEKWFHAYMKSPQQYSPNTVMPSFWPGGRAIRKDILDGDVDAQVSALWRYLLDDRQARPPKGLVEEPLILVADDEAVMLRRSYPGVGKRGIGVGYPSQVNLVFDAEQMRLAMLWQGKFADPGGVWRSQGHGNVRPLSRDVLRFPAGPELDDADSPWIVDEGRPPNHHFRGYFLDDRQRPTFMYRFENVEVEDYPIDIQDAPGGRTFIRRTSCIPIKGRACKRRLPRRGSSKNRPRRRRLVSHGRQAACSCC